jgi:hypothetical protein
MNICVTTWGSGSEALASAVGGVITSFGVGGGSSSGDLGAGDAVGYITSVGFSTNPVFRAYGVVLGSGYSGTQTVVVAQSVLCTYAEVGAGQTTIPFGEIDYDVIAGAGQTTIPFGEIEYEIVVGAGQGTVPSTTSGLLYIINPTNGAVSTHSATPTHICAHDGELYGSSGTALVRFDGEPASGYVVFGEIEFDSDRLSNVHELAVNYDGDDDVSATVVYGDTEFGPYESVMSDRRFKASKSSTAYSRTPQIRVQWPAGVERIDRVDVYTTPHPRRRS